MFSKTVAIELYKGKPIQEYCGHKHVQVMGQAKESGGGIWSPEESTTIVCCGRESDTSIV